MGEWIVMTKRKYLEKLNLALAAALLLAIPGQKAMAQVVPDLRETLGVTQDDICEPSANCLFPTGSNG